MKKIFNIVIVLLFFTSTTLQAKKFPSGIPAAIDGDITFATIIDSRSLKSTHIDLNKDDLIEVDGYLVVDQKTILHSIKTSDVIEQLQENTSEDGPIAMCFNPRHYISYHSIYGKVNLFICYECSRLIISIEGWRKSLSLNKESVVNLNLFYDSINLALPRYYQEKPNKKRNEIDVPI